MHPKHHTSAIDSLAAIGKMDPKLGMPLLLSILFYNKILCSSGSDSPDILVSCQNWTCIAISGCIELN